MPVIKHVLAVEPSCHHQLVLVVGHLAVCSLLWFWLHGPYWAWFVVGAVLSLGYSLYLARQRRFILTLQGNELIWQGERYRLGQASRVGYGFLWLELKGARLTHLWLFGDSMSQADYRCLAQRITLLR